MSRRLDVLLNLPCVIECPRIALALRTMRVMLNIQTPQKERAMTIADELINRNKCRFKLQGVLIAVDGAGPEQVIRSCYWNKDSQLVVVLEGGQELSPDRCVLRSQ